MGVKVVERPKGSGTWWVFIYHKGRRKAKKVGSEDAARKVAKIVEAKLTLGDFGFVKKNVAPTFKECALKWLAVPHGWRESTCRIHEFNLKKYIFPRLGRRSIDEIRRRDIKKFVDTLLLKELAPRTVRNMKSTISGVFCHAVDDELVEANPVRDIKLAIRKRTVEIDPLTEEEAEGLLERTKSYKGGVYYPILLCALRTGMRIGEIQALEWGDVDFNGRFIEVRRSWRSGRLTGTKNRKRRRVDMTPMLTKALRDLRIREKRRALKQGGRSLSGSLRTTRAGSSAGTPSGMVSTNALSLRASARSVFMI